jgi:F-type H+-transporting ATPase subunit a
MSITVFFIIQFNSVKSRGIKGYFKHYAEPFAFMIPINIMEEVVFPVSLSFRIFGNILAGVIVVELWMNMMATASKAILRPIPLLDNIPILQAVSPLPVQAFFDIFEPVLQAFVFSMLTMVFIAKAIVVHNREE